jgi:ABC-type multidrug transport system ATPase subunit
VSGGVRVRATDLGVTIGGREVLAAIDATFEPGTLTAVVGPSGSGKTTLFNVLARLRQPTSGRVDVDGRRISESPARIALVHQAFALLSLLTAAENVELAAQIAGLPRAAVIAAAERCLDAVDLSHRAHHLVEELSGGEQQRVAIARAMITNPELMLADEPTAQLDPKNREHIVDLLRGMAAGGATVLIATHDLEVATQCDAVLELRAGRVAAG